ncbi:MAG: hypothetical protein ACTS73_01670 [Arsenophonus sp. NEOnobi-MAG3]
MSDEILEKFNVESLLAVFLSRSLIKSPSFPWMELNGRKKPLPASMKLVSIV